MAVLFLSRYCYWLIISASSSCGLRNGEELLFIIVVQDLVHRALSLKFEDVLHVAEKKLYLYHTSCWCFRFNGITIVLCSSFVTHISLFTF